ncbi:AmmeMemoRadiSam system protein A [Dethiosulfatarculus sandiegensis]|uniref:AMMECR1 domain-containing protein n=1 Tax=Dethiosulfatarculus sandiegensis TaxID=1429043 RepID=A0A0D2JRE9_9BACT|nr:AmmeMemoRadiSam system protein A [Dethiosulfatarculus sandiegensis]KIX12035.1 hypothetical protein X474_21275 [Dethiosulfatarculus sandiegensis]
MTDDRELTLEEKKELLELARATVENAVKGLAEKKPQSKLAGLAFKRGAFVTLNRNGRLRGCIGNFVSEDSLLETVKDMAISAAQRDPRFPPVAPYELDDLEFEISVLSPLKETGDPLQIEVGKHGIFLVSPMGRGVLLPQVATEYGWDREEFLDQTCFKAGLPKGAWKEPQTRIFIFSAQVFGEKDLGE